jgi:hypothetical protein
MQTTAETLTETAHIVATHGRHIGEQFAASDSDAVDICAAAYMAAEGFCPIEFSTDEIASIRLIEASAPAMAAIRAISDALDSSVCETEIAPGVYVPDYIEHVSNWAATPPIGCTEPPTTSEVIGRILRARDNLTTPTTNAHAA